MDNATPWAPPLPYTRMKKILLLALATSFALLNAAQAIPFISVVRPASWTLANQGQINFDSSLPSGVFISTNGDQYTGIRDGGLGLNPGISAPPPGDTSNYYTVGAYGTATFSFTSTQDSLSFLWGSIDAYNVLQFSLGDGPITTILGSQIPDFAGLQTADGAARVTFTNLLFDHVTFSNSPNIYAFEFDDINTTAVSVPDGGSTLTLLGLALTGIAAVRRKMSALVA